MKFITFALILQFLIACWPKVDIISKDLNKKSIINSGVIYLSIYRSLKRGNARPCYLLLT